MEMGSCFIPVQQIQSASFLCLREGSGLQRAQLEGRQQREIAHTAGHKATCRLSNQVFVSKARLRAARWAVTKVVISNDTYSENDVIAGLPL
jgi:hypothetical protein